MNKIVIMTLITASLCLGGDTVTRELNRVKDKLTWLQTEKRFHEELWMKLRQIEDGQLNDVNSEKVKVIMDDYTFGIANTWKPWGTRSSKDIEFINSLHKKLKKIKD